MIIDLGTITCRTENKNKRKTTLISEHAAIIVRVERRHLTRGKDAYTWHYIQNNKIQQNVAIRRTYEFTGEKPSLNRQARREVRERWIRDLREGLELVFEITTNEFELREEVLGIQLCLEWEHVTA